MFKILFALYIVCYTLASFADPMHIVFSSDQNFGRPTCITIASILLNADKDDEFYFYVIDLGIGDNDKQKIANLKKIKPFTIQYIKLTNQMTNELHIDMSGEYIKRCGGLATYARLFIPKLFPNLERIIYLDTDILVRSSLRTLWNSKLDNEYAKAVPDIGVQLCKKVKIAKNNVLEYNQPNPGKLYFNAGILLLNMKKINEDNLYNQFISTANEFELLRSKKIDWVDFHDQDVLNSVFGNKISYLDVKYNYYVPFSINGKMMYNNNSTTAKDAVIFHFIGKRKPWTWNYIYDELPLKEYSQISDIAGYPCRINEKIRRFYLSIKSWFKF